MVLGGAVLAHLELGVLEVGRQLDPLEARRNSLLYDVPYWSLQTIQKHAAFQANSTDKHNMTANKKNTLEN